MILPRIAIAQVDSTVGDVRANVLRICRALDRAPDNTLVVFPEMALSGYPLEDLSYSTDLQLETQAGLHEIAEHLRQYPRKRAIVGYLASPEPGGKPRNGVALIEPGLVADTQYKIDLPTYGVFDERRLFDSGDQILSGTFQGLSWAVVVCEDLWVAGQALDLVKKIQPHVLIAINGSPFEEGKHVRRVDVMRKALLHAEAKYGVYVNLAGGQDDLIFDGGSFVFDRQRDDRIAQLPFFTEDLTTVEVSSLGGLFPLGEYATPREAMLYNGAVCGLRSYVEKNHFRGALVGVSGGIDSALVMAMAADALGGDRVLGIAMPSKYSSDHSLRDAEQLMLNVRGGYRVHPIAGAFDAFQRTLMLDGVAAENLQARIRGTTLMGISNAEGWVVLAPGNKSELAMGYSTLYGDTVGGYAPLKDLFKIDVYALARWRNEQGVVIPVSSIEKEPSAELAPGQRDSDSLPPYEILDSFLRRAIEQREERASLARDFGEALTENLLTKLRRAEWKRRQYPIGPKLSTLSFGRERFMPITNNMLSVAPQQALEAPEQIQGDICNTA